jgi:hypothetical protein
MEINKNYANELTVGINKENVAERILVVQAFTVHQVRRLISVELPKVIEKYQVRSVIVPGLLNAFVKDSNMRTKDVQKEIAKLMEAINELSRRVLVVISIQKSRFSELVLCIFKKRINLVQKEEKRYGNLKAEIYNHGDCKIVNLTEKELKTILKSRCSMYTP